MIFQAVSVGSSLWVGNWISISVSSVPGVMPSGIGAPLTIGPAGLTMGGFSALGGLTTRGGSTASPIPAGGSLSGALLPALATKLSNAARSCRKPVMNWVRPLGVTPARQSRPACSTTPSLAIAMARVVTPTSSLKRLMVASAGVPLAVARSVSLVPFCSRLSVVSRLLSLNA